MSDEQLRNARAKAATMTREELERALSYRVELTSAQEQATRERLAELSDRSASA